MLKIYNSATRKKEEFVPKTAGKVSMYACGPTVYNYIHIGNARTFLTFDVVRRYLSWAGFEVTFVQNVTDVDDKIIKRAAEEGRSAEELAADYMQKFISSMHEFGIKDPDVRPQATKEIGPMIGLVKKLIDNGYAYEADGDVYFEVRKFKPYGQLSGRDIDELQSGARVEVDERKKDPLDFALWKAAKEGEPAWKSPWGMGRPGWHLECSAMSEKYLGLPIDIHGGGADLIFPHHENEKAQTEAATGKQFVKYWLHGGMLRINNEKMSKSLGNFLLLNDVLEHCNPMALRLLMLQTHYRSPLDFSDARLKEAESSYERMSTAVRNFAWKAQHLNDDFCDGASAKGGEHPVSVGGVERGGANGGAEGGEHPTSSATDLDKEIAALKEIIEQTQGSFKESMDDDFNTAGALAALFSLVSAGNTFIEKYDNAVLEMQKVGGAGAESKEGIGDAASAILLLAANTISELLGVLGITLPEVEQEWPKETCDLAAKICQYAGDDAHEAADALLDARAKARKEKNWDIADSIRDGLSELGFVIEDTASGARVIYNA